MAFSVKCTNCLEHDEDCVHPKSTRQKSCDACAFSKAKCDLQEKLRRSGKKRKRHEGGEESELEDIVSPPPPLPRSAPATPKAEPTFQSVFHQQSCSEEWIERRELMKKAILKVLIAYKPAGLIDIKDWADYGVWIELAMSEAEFGDPRYMLKTVQRFIDKTREKENVGLETQEDDVGEPDVAN